MPTKATLHILPTDIPTREVEIPDACPNCRADLTQRGAICANSYVFALAVCHVNPTDPTEGPEVEYETEAASGEILCFGYACQACEHDLTARVETGSAHMAGMREVAHVLTADSLEIEGNVVR